MHLLRIKKLVLKVAGLSLIVYSHTVICTVRQDINYKEQLKSCLNCGLLVYSEIKATILKKCNSSYEIRTRGGETGLTACI
jgi:hypothetical protein